MRTLSTAARQGLFAQDTDKVYLLALTLSHPSLVQPIRVVNDRDPLISQGYTYAAYPFAITLPFQRDDQIPVMKIQIDNVDRQIIIGVRNIDGPLNVALDVLVADQPEIIEAHFEGFQLKNVSYDAIIIEGDLRLEEILTEPYPGHSMTPQYAPGIFGNA